MRLTRNDRKAIIIIVGALLLLNIGVWVHKRAKVKEFESSKVQEFESKTQNSTSPKTHRSPYKYKYAKKERQHVSQFADRRADTLQRYPKYTPFKLQAGQTIPLASADTAELKRIPGIGSYYSAKIVRYRERLGGFVSLSQLTEIEGLPEGIARWFTLSASEIRKLPINTGTFGQLLRHPYLNFEQVRAIMNYRKAYGTLRSLDDLKTYSAFTDSDFLRLKPYVAF